MNTITKLSDFTDAYLQEHYGNATDKEKTQIRNAISIGKEWEVQRRTHNILSVAKLAEEKNILGLSAALKEVANDNWESPVLTTAEQMLKWSDEDMRNCYAEGMDFMLGEKSDTLPFEDYLQFLIEKKQNN